jgi:hypothetical protein
LWSDAVFAVSLPHLCPGRARLVRNSASSEDDVPSTTCNQLTTTRPFSPPHHQQQALQTKQCRSRVPPWHCAPRMRSAPAPDSRPPHKQPHSNNASEHSPRRDSSWRLTTAPTRTTTTLPEPGCGASIRRRSTKRRAGRISSSMGSSGP